MINQILAQVKVNDTLREAEKARLIEIANRVQKDQFRQRLEKLACQFKLTHTC